MTDAGPSYGHYYRLVRAGRLRFYVIGWTWRRRRRGAEFEARAERSTTTAGARRFAKKWGLPWH